MGQLIQELKRRNVIRVAIAYAVSTWLLIEVTATVFPILSLPEWSVTLVTVLLLIGFPIALIFAWAFELTPEGLKLEKHVVRDESITQHTGRKLDFVIIAMLVVALGYFGYDKFVLDPSRDAELVQATTDDKSIAVLAFVNMSDDPGNEYFSDGLSEEILNLLAKIPDLKVIGRTSSFSFKGKNEDLRIIGQTLGVKTLLEGSVRKSGNEIRITAQLIDTSDASHIWSQTYDRTLSDIFAVQDDVAAAVVESLRVKLLDELPKAQRTDPEAYSLLLKSRAPARRSTEAGFEGASRLLTQALAIDPEYAAAWGELAINQANQAIGKKVAPEKGYARAQVSAHRALILDPSNVDALVSLGAVELFWNWDLEAAGEWFRIARDVAPGSSRPLNALAMWTGALGRDEAALALYEEALDRDPLNLNLLANLAGASDRTENARIHIEAMKQIDPDADRIPAASGWLEWRLDNFEEALLHSDQMEEPEVLRACALHDLGRISDAEVELEGLQRQSDDALRPYAVAEIYACWDYKDEAFEWLERAYGEHDPSLVELRAKISGIGTSEVMRNLHDDPRWETLLQKLGLSDQHAEKLGL